jgi:hypothetical protein
LARLGLDRDQVRPWEDGRRGSGEKSSYEWWYFDGLLDGSLDGSPDDGTVIVAWLGENWPYGSNTRNVSLEITPPGQPTRRFTKAYAGPGSFSTEKADIRFGPHSFSGDLDTYRIVVDAADSGGLGIDLTLRRTIASWRPGSGLVEAGTRHFAWLVAVPNGEISGTMTLDGNTREVHGSGYHDHNWGNVSPVLLMDSWWWGRALVGDRTVIVSELRATASQGGGRHPLCFVASPRGVELSVWDPEEIHVTEGKPVRHPDPLHVRPIGESITFAAANGFSATFPISEHYLSSVDLVANQNFGVKALTAFSGIKPWYSRFFSTVTLEIPGEGEASGEGTLEYFEFR